MPDTKEQATPTTRTDEAEQCPVRGSLAPRYPYVPASFARQLETELAEAKAINTHRRLFDLVRYQRAELHGADLITDDEYAWLCGHEFPEDKGKLGSPSPRRLEDYDEMRQRLAAMEEAAMKSIEAVADAGAWGIDHVGAANYRERQQEASDHLEKVKEDAVCSVVKQREGGN